jgi:hypothetical protein
VSLVRLTILVVAAAAACGRGGQQKVVVPLRDPYSGAETSDLDRLKRELELEILESYGRELDGEAPGVRGKTVAIRIGTGPDELAWKRELAELPRRRWPVAEGQPVSKLLEVHLVPDGSTAWAYDDVSYRLDVCGRVAVIPLRLTSLYLRDGERWVLVMEHMSFARTLTGPRATSNNEENWEGWTGSVSTSAAGTMVKRVAAKALIEGFTTSAETLVLWPDPQSEVRGQAASGLTLSAALGGVAVSIEGDRTGVTTAIGDSKRTYAWWAGTLKSERAPGDPDQRPIHLRATAVLSQSAGVWTVEQLHVSAPISDAELASTVLGSAWGAPCELQKNLSPEAPETSGD